MSNPTPDFSAQLSKPATEFKKPPTWPAGTYHGRIVSQEFGKSSQRQTPYCRYHLAITGAGEDIDPASLEGIDLSKRQFRTDFYLTDDATFRLTEFLKSCGATLDGRSLAECIPDAINADVLVKLGIDMNQTTNEPFNTVKDVRGKAA